MRKVDRKWRIEIESKQRTLKAKVERIESESRERIESEIWKSQRMKRGVVYIGWKRIGCRNL